MKTRYLLAGISAMAFAATTASAQNTNSANSSGGTGNTAVCTNNSLNSTGNTCDIDVVGSNNSATITQAGNNNTGDIDTVGNSNTAGITQPGNNSTATIVQNGFSEGEVAEDNSVNITQNGNRSSASVTQSGTRHSATVVQRGRWNVTDIDQSGDLQGAVVRQLSSGTTTEGNGNTADIDQIGTGSRADDHNYVSADQRGERNSVTVTQEAGSDHNSSVSIQGGDLNVDGTAVNGQSGTDNSITVTQRGSFNSSFVDQRDTDGENRSVSGNTAQVDQGGSFNRSNVYQDEDNNFANIFMGGNGNLSDITQDSDNNYAFNAVFGGEIQSNSSTIVQRGGNNNEADVSVARGIGEAAVKGNQQTSDVDQNGRDNYASVTITSGLAGNNVTNDETPGQGVEGGRTGGNFVSIDQIGGANTAVTTTGNVNQQFRGFGNSATITQTATRNYQNQTVNEGQGTTSANQSTTANAASGRIGYSEFDTDDTPGSTNFTGSRGNYVETWQQGRFDTLEVVQADNTNGSGVVYQDGSIGRARAAVYQNGSVGFVRVDQTGDNYGEVTQGLGTEQFAPAGNSARLTQVDSGDDATPGAPGGTTTIVDEFGNPGTVNNPPGADVPVRQYNQALLTQYGFGNEMLVNQNAENGYVSAFQRATYVGPDGPDEGTAGDVVSTNSLRMDVAQGTGRSNDLANLGATPETLALNNTQTAGGSDSATATLEQGGVNNAIRVDQDSSNSRIDVLQLGSGAGAYTDADFNGGGFTGTPQANIIIVAQQGTGNRATAVQREGVGRSTCSGQAAGGANCPASGNSNVQNEALDPGIQNPPADDFYFAGGERSAEIDILQGGSNNNARAEQRGLGQYARIEQAGSGNNASILQDTGAENATAVIRQRGNNNSYSIYQNLPGQYVAVDQTGSNNGTRVGRGANTGSNGEGTGAVTGVPAANAGVNP